MDCEEFQQELLEVMKNILETLQHLEFVITGSIKSGNSNE